MSENTPTKELTVTEIYKLEKIGTRKNLELALNSMKPQIEMALPKHLTADRLLRVAITAVSKTPKLMECTPVSIIGAIIESSQLGLMPDGVLGEAYLIPFNNKKQINGQWVSRMEAQFIPGYRGLVALAHRSGMIKTIFAKAVYAKDTFDYEFGLSPDLKHKPTSEVDRGEITHFYAVALFNNGASAFEVMTRAEIDFVRSKGKGKNNAVWDDWFDQMGNKTVLRRLCKSLPLSPEMSRAVGLAEAEDTDKSQKNYADILGFSGVNPELKKQAENELTFDAFTEVAEEREYRNDAKVQNVDTLIDKGTEAIKIEAVEPKITQAVRTPIPVKEEKPKAQAIVKNDDFLKEMNEPIKETVTEEIFETKKEDEVITPKPIEKYSDAVLMGMGTTSAIQDILKHYKIDPSTIPGKNTNAKFRKLIIGKQNGSYDAVVFKMKQEAEKEAKEVAVAPKAEEIIEKTPVAMNDAIDEDPMDTVAEFIKANPVVAGKRTFNQMREMLQMCEDLLKVDSTMINNSLQADDELKKKYLDEEVLLKTATSEEIISVLLGARE